MINKHLIGLLTTITFSLNVNATEIYTVDNLILKSLNNSPDLKISKYKYDASTKRYDAAFSGYLPKVDLAASAGQVSQSKVFYMPSVDDTLLLGQISLKQLIYDFGKTSGNSNSKKYTANSYNMDNMQKISNKIKDVKQAYYNVLKAKALIDVHKESVKLNESQLYRSKRYFEAGIRTKIDVSDAEVRVIKAKLELKKAQYNLRFAYANLDQIVGFNELVQTYEVYSPEIDLYSSLKDYPLDLKDAIIYAYENRYELKQEQEHIKASKANIDITSSQYFPSLYVNADYLYQKADEYQQFVPQDKWNANVNLNWNLYHGGYTTATKQESIINLSIANSKLAVSKLKIKKSTTRAYINLYKAKDTVKLDQNLVKVSNEKFNQASKRYEYGLSDYIELQEARQGYIDSKATLVIDYYNYYIAIAGLDNAIGK
jgi:outer membrane protein